MWEIPLHPFCGPVLRVPFLNGVPNPRRWAPGPSVRARALILVSSLRTMLFGVWSDRRESRPFRCGCAKDYSPTWSVPHEGGAGSSLSDTLPLRGTGSLLERQALPAVCTGVEWLGWGSRAVPPSLDRWQIPNTT
jgi:hypothetical protein